MIWMRSSDSSHFLARHIFMLPFIFSTSSFVGRRLLSFSIAIFTADLKSSCVGVGFCFRARSNVSATCRSGSSA